MSVSPRPSQAIPMSDDASHDIARQLRLSTSTDDNPKTPPPPSFITMFSLLTMRDFVVLGLAPFMTFVIGEAFQAFALFSSSPPSSDADDTLLSSIGVRGVGTCSVLRQAPSFFRFSQAGFGFLLEKQVTLAVRSMVYTSMLEKPMVWFDDTLKLAESRDSASLMSRFSKESDEIRAASSLPTGLIIQHLTTVVACLVLAFQRSPRPISRCARRCTCACSHPDISQVLGNPLWAQENQFLGQASTPFPFTESDRLSHPLAGWRSTIVKLGVAGGMTQGLFQFSTMAMFVQAFWFGGKLVLDGKLLAGDVMTIFWACLIALSSIQSCIPQLQVVNRGASAFASLLSLTDRELPETQRYPPGQLGKIVPSYFNGELNLEDVTFAYPSRPSVLALSDRKPTFIVGASGSGKSTVAQLLLAMYTPKAGEVTADKHIVQYLAPHFLRKHIACVSQSGVIFELSVHDNVALGVAGTGRSLHSVTRQEVQDVCTAALLHEFVRELPDGYDTKLGNNGTTWSGGQAQRLEIARALLRDPDVLILDEATSALDITSRLLVFEAIRQRRAKKTTVVITHDLSQIKSDDFVYFLKNGTVAEKGYRDELEQSSGDFRQLPVLASHHPRSIISMENLSSHLSSGFGKHSSVLASQPRPFTLSNWIPDSYQSPHSPTAARTFKHVSTAPSLGFDPEKDFLARRGAYAVHSRKSIFWSSSENIQPSEPAEIEQNHPLPYQGLIGLVPQKLPSFVQQDLFFLALILSVLGGVMTPVFSFLLSQVMVQVSTGDGCFIGCRLFLTETIGVRWVTRVQKLAFDLILKQDCSWFDEPGHSSQEMVQTLVKDASDARDLWALVGRIITPVAMFIAGLIWALTVGWQLTLAGFAVIPLFVGVLAFQGRLGARREIQHKEAKEVVASSFYVTVSNIRAAVRNNFENAASHAYRAGVRSGSFDGVAYGFTNGLIYLAEALLFYVGALLLARRTYTYPQMIQTLNLVIFSVTVGSQLLGLAGHLMKSIAASRSLMDLILLSAEGFEAQGSICPSNMTSLGFHDVSFRYPQREEDFVFKGLQLHVPTGEHVAVVGSSGCGKSTVAALLQRLYYPEQGLVSVGGQDISMLDVEHLRRAVTVVSQLQHNFDGTVREHIAFNAPNLTNSDVENGPQLSAGQVQRLSIARALARATDVLILDECTSALDPSTEDAVCKSIQNFRNGKTTVWITHKLSVMKRCDRIVVLDGGKVAESGTFEELMHARGTFSQLASGGDWS
ncbi:P-loop containing nucleoside triphosphate hydrolase protein [Flagelloscypha sp. PMI_526]|nr:P-loop containing nucleoside triphosphate hydrolase protein [Flagelloscypha sp. PMI_526]